MVALASPPSVPQPRALVPATAVAVPQLLPLDDDASRTRRGDSLLLDVAHELRSPLLSFNLALAGLADRAQMTGDRQAERLTAVLQRSLVHLQALVENMLDAASIDEHAFHLTLTPTDLTAILDEAIQIVDPLLQPHGQRVRVEAHHAGMVRADAQHVRQVLVNLLHNAVKYGPDGGAIVVCTRLQGDWVAVEVADSGGGIPVDEQPYIFDRFFRGRAARDTQRGSGLGLAIVKEIVRAHGGEVGVESGPLQGTRVWFTLHRI